MTMLRSPVWLCKKKIIYIVKKINPCNKTFQSDIYFMTPSVCCFHIRAERVAHLLLSSLTPAFSLRKPDATWAFARAWARYRITGRPRSTLTYFLPETLPGAAGGISSSSSSPLPLCRLVSWERARGVRSRISGRGLQWRRVHRGRRINSQRNAMELKTDEKAAERPCDV